MATLPACAYLSINVSVICHFVSVSFIPTVNVGCARVRRSQERELKTFAKQNFREN